MIAHPPPPTRAQMVGSVIREVSLVLLAFAAGAGAYVGSLKEPARWPEDYFGAVGAGAILALAKMIPTGGQSRG